MGESSASRPYLYCYFDTDAVERIRIDSEEFIVGFCICRVRIVRSKRLSSLEGTNRDVYPTTIAIRITIALIALAHLLIITFLTSIGK